MLCLPVGLQPAEIPRPRVGANSPTPCDVCTKLSLGDTPELAALYIRNHMRFARRQYAEVEEGTIPIWSSMYRLYSRVLFFHIPYFSVPYSALSLKNHQFLRYLETIPRPVTKVVNLLEAALRATKPRSHDGKHFLVGLACPAVSKGPVFSFKSANLDGPSFSASAQGMQSNLEKETKEDEVRSLRKRGWYLGTLAVSHQTRQDMNGASLGRWKKCIGSYQVFSQL